MEVEGLSDESGECGCGKGGRDRDPAWWKNTWPPLWRMSSQLMIYHGLGSGRATRWAAAAPAERVWFCTNGLVNGKKKQKRFLLRGALHFFVMYSFVYLSCKFTDCNLRQWGGRAQTLPLLPMTYFGGSELYLNAPRLEPQFCYSFRQKNKNCWTAQFGGSLFIENTAMEHSATTPELLPVIKRQVVLFFFPPSVYAPSKPWCAFGSS